MGVWVGSLEVVGEVFVGEAPFGPEVEVAHDGVGRLLGDELVGGDGVEAAIFRAVDEGAAGFGGELVGVDGFER